jgi:DNA-binding transcriptional regulator YhcF (GntR family)
MAEPTRGQRWGRVDLASVCALAPNHTAVSVYAYLCCHANRRGEAWPRVATVAADLSVSTATVRRAIAALLTADVVARKSPTMLVVRAIARA